MAADDDGFVLDLTPRVKARLAWDLIEHDKVKEWLPKLGLIPPSDESLEMDHIECHARAQMVQPLGNLMDVFSSICSEIHAAYVIDAAGEEIPEEHRAEAREGYADIAYRIIQSSSISIIAELMQEDILAYGPAVHRG